MGSRDFRGTVTLLMVERAKTWNISIPEGTVTLLGCCRKRSDNCGYETNCSPTQCTCQRRHISYAGYRFPPDVISYAVWLYYRFPLSLRMVEELLVARGIDLTYETVRRLVGEVRPGYRPAHPLYRAGPRR
jgi:hypothetical protein